MGTPENVMQINLFSLGTKLYNCQRWVNYRCVLVFVLRSLLHREEREALQRFLAGNALREQFFEVHPEVFAQLTRQFFFRGSTAAVHYGNLFADGAVFFCGDNGTALFR